MSKPGKRRAVRWKPFFSWLNGKPKEPIVLGLTEVQAETIVDALNMLGITVKVWTPGLRAAYTRASNLASRRNLKPLSDREYGEIRSKDF